MKINFNAILQYLQNMADLARIVYKFTGPFAPPWGGIKEMLYQNCVDWTGPSKEGNVNMII